MGWITILRNWKPIAFLLAAIGLYLKGRSDDAARANSRKMKEELEAHERVNEADLGLGATDGDRIERLREFADRHGKRE